jgi:hypothetical protein
MDYSIFGTVLYALSAAAYALLLILLLASKNSNTTRTILLAACSGTIASDIAIAAGFSSILGLGGAFLELAIAGMWCVFALHLLLRQLPEKRPLIYSVVGCGISLCVLVVIFGSVVTGQIDDGEKTSFVT